MKELWLSVAMQARKNYWAPAAYAAVTIHQQELLEDDVKEESPSLSEYKNVSSNLPTFKDFYLVVKVSQQKYKDKFVPGQITEAESI